MDGYCSIGISIECDDKDADDALRFSQSLIGRPEAAVEAAMAEQFQSLERARRIEIGAALRVGAGLANLKSRGHGHYLPAVERVFAGSLRSANNYRRLWDAYERLPNIRGAILGAKSINHALRIVTGLKKTANPEAPEKLNRSRKLQNIKDRLTAYAQGRENAMANLFAGVSGVLENRNPSDVADFVGLLSEYLVSMPSIEAAATANPSWSQSERHGSARALEWQDESHKAIATSYKRQKIAGAGTMSFVSTDGSPLTLAEVSAEMSRAAMAIAALDVPGMTLATAAKFSLQIGGGVENRGDGHPIARLTAPFMVSAASRPLSGPLDAQSAFAVAQCQGMSSSRRFCGQPLTRRVSRSVR